MNQSPVQTALQTLIPTPERREDGRYTATLQFPADFPGFRGHFPGNPIVPGVCLISAVELLARKIADNPALRMTRIIAAKLRVPVLPMVPVQVSATLTEGPEPVISAELACEGASAPSSIRLQMGPEPIHPVLLHFYPEETPLRRLLVKHSTQVRDKAFAILSNPACRHLKLDLCLVAEGALLHDIGIGRCNAPKIQCCGTEPYIAHGVIGARMLRELSPEYERIARICERHTGSGITAEDVRKQGIPIPEADYLPESLEEKLVCLADKFYSKSGDMQEEPLEMVRAELARFGAASLGRFDDLCRIFEVK